MEEESLCWTCMRANARPDPDGCPYHRFGKLCFDAWKIETYTYGDSREIPILIVTKCKLHDEVTQSKRNKRLKKGR